MNSFENEDEAAAERRANICVSSARAINAATIVLSEKIAQQTKNGRSSWRTGAIGDHYDVVLGVIMAVYDRAFDEAVDQ